MEVRDPFTETVKSVNEANRALIVNNLGPVRPLIVFPISTSGKRTFKFQSRWYDLYSWPEYSVLTDAAFCFYCRCTVHLLLLMLLELNISVTMYE